MEGRRASDRGACCGLVGEMPIAEPSSSSGSGPMKRLATNGHAYYSVAPQTDAAWHDLLTRVAEEAGVAFDFVSYPLPQPLGGPCAIRTPVIMRCDTTYCSTGPLSGRDYIPRSWEASAPCRRSSMRYWKARSMWDLSTRIGTC